MSLRCYLFDEKNAERKNAKMNFFAPKYQHQFNR